jgi:hypothetical protein
MISIIAKFVVINTIMETISTAHSSEGKLRVVVPGDYIDEG